MSMTNDWANSVVAHLFGGGALTQPSAWWLAAFTTAPSNDGTGGVEVSDAGYSRQNVTAWTLDTANRQAQNTAIVNFGTAAADITSNIVAVCIMSAETGGVVRHIGTVNNPQTVTAGNPITILALGASFSLPAPA